MTPALELKEISRRFGNVIALDAASLRLRAGTVHAVLGENGAGKTTLMRIAYGITRPDSGLILRRGAPVRIRHPSEAMALGIGMVHQHFSLVPAMSVAENVALGLHGRFRVRDAQKLVAELSGSTGLSVDPRARIERLPIASQQRVEILKALAHDATVLILDEPTALLAPAETDELLGWVRAFVAGTDKSVVLITHKLREALAAADDVTVLREGKTVYTATAVDTTEDVLVAAMIGEGVGPVIALKREQHLRRRPVLELRGVGLKTSEGRSVLQNVDLEVSSHEVVGIAAVEGEGHRELLRILAGRTRPDAGEATLPEDVGFVPDDRHRDATILEMSLTQNMLLRGLHARRGRIDWKGAREKTIAAMKSFQVRASAPETPIATLSGGNQQRFVLARELDPLPAALVVENPSRGLDIRATASVHQKILEARDSGVAVVLYSSDVDEVLALADRVLVVHRGRVTPVASQKDEVGRTMLGAAAL